MKNILQFENTSYLYGMKKQNSSTGRKKLPAEDKKVMISTYVKAKNKKECKKIIDKAVEDYESNTK